MTLQDDEHVWKRRWMLMNALRIGGVVTAICGLFIWRRDLLGYQNDLIGQILLVLGAIDALFIPVVLSRYWGIGKGQQRGHQGNDPRP